MKKKLLILVLTVVLCLIQALPLYAEDGFVDEYYRLQDMAELLSESEEAALIEKLDELSIRQKMDVVILTTNEQYDGGIVALADDYYDYCKFGYGENRDGLMLLINMATSDWYITTCGWGITAFTDAGIQYIGKQIVPYLSDGDYVGAFDLFITLCDDFITQARNGEPYDISTLPREPFDLIMIPICLVIGLIISLITVGRMKAKLKTVRAQTAANNYMKENSLNITDSRETYLYKTTTKAKKAQSSSSGGGSSTHTSSSGTEHGGGGGKF